MEKLVSAYLYLSREGRRKGERKGEEGKEGGKEGNREGEIEEGDRMGRE